jgi:methionine sulfoxide reductase heme-binding subunit
VTPRTEPGIGYAAALMAAAGLGGVALIVANRWFGVALSPLTWQLVRASGFVAYIALWASTVYGIGLTTGSLDRFGGRAMVCGAHVFVTYLAYGFLALHLITLAVDPYSAYGLRELTVPFMTGWREPWTGIGVVSMWLTVVVGVTSAARSRIGQTAFRALHWLAFPLYLTALAHGIGSGSDTPSGWAQAIYLGSGFVVVWLLAIRISLGRRRRGGTGRRAAVG